jgi:serine/threonine protein kinase/Flp pilus assembly protein TadD
MSEQQALPPEWSSHNPSPPAGEQPTTSTDWTNLESEVLGEFLESSGTEAPPPSFSSTPWLDAPAPAADISRILVEDYRQRLQRQSTTADSSDESMSIDRGSMPSIIRGSGFLRSRHDDPSAAETTQLPELGECLFGFLLRRELGRGAFARVFEAEQIDLAGRPVVLKVSRMEGSEPQTLAQLQHTHIVPIFSLHEDTAAGLRAVCMPYFGGASLSRVLQAMSAATARARRGQELLDALDAVAAPLPQMPQAGESGDQTPRAIISRLGYAETVVWIGARLAEALHHAHQRGILHRDIKPPNILLGTDGQPMLLDFNLAHDDRNPTTDASLGGTVSYMAPEHLRAVASRDPAQARKVDARSDIYSLGMVLFEMLAGRRPFACSIGSNPAAFYLESMAIERSRAAPSLRSLRSDIPWGLDSILKRCLAPDPKKRYANAEQLAEDLRRFLSDDPLRYAPEPSIKERARKWVRRHPRLSYSGGVALAASLLLGLLGLALLGTRSLLADTRAQEHRRTFREKVTHALFLVNTTSEMADHLGEGIRTCEEALGIWNLLHASQWREPAEWGKVPEERESLAQDARELLLLLAGARVRQEPRNPDALHAAVRLLDKAEGIPGLAPSRALWEDRAAYREALGDRHGAALARTQAAAIEPVTAQEHYLVAMTYARSRRFDLAVRHLNEAVRLQPRHYWSFAQRGLCRLERGELELAASDLSVCIGLWPDYAWGYLNRAAVLARCGRRAEAIADYDAALRWDHSLTAVFLNRGLLHLELEHYPAALADFREAAARGRDDAFLHSGYGVALERLGRHVEADEEFHHATARAAQLPADAQLRLRWVYGFAVAKRKPAEARAAFEEVLHENPEHPQALYGLGMLLEQAGKLVEALPYYHRALEASPGFVAPRRARAVVLARLGERNRATQEINDCLARDPQSGVTIYAAACVAALLARKTSPGAARQATDHALYLLAEAFRQHYGQDRAAQDQDLEGLHHDPRFQQLLQNAQQESSPGQT